MEGLRDLLDDVATQAKPYDVVNRVETVARRRRRMMRLTPVAAAVAVTALIGAGWFTIGRGDGGGEPAASGPSAVVDWMPASVAVPAGAPPPLPPDGIGAAALVYERGNRDGKLLSDPGWNLVDSEGRQYWIDPMNGKAGRGSSQRPLGLSPDGRWLVLARNGTTVIRDLSGSQERKVADRAMSVAFWSPDGQRLLLTSNQDKANAVVVDIATGTSSPLSLAGYPDTEVVGIHPSGELVLRVQDKDVMDQLIPAGPTAKTLKLLLVNLANSASRRLDVDLASVLSGGATLPPESHHVAGQDTAALLDNGSLLVRTYRTSTDGGLTGSLPDDLLVIDLATGALVKQHALPDPTARTATNDQRIFSVYESRSMLSATGGGVLTVMDKSSDTISGPVAIELLDLATGNLTPVTGLVGDIATVLLRGQT